MKRSIFFFGVIAAALVFLAGCSGGSHAVDKSMNGQTINAKVGDTVVVTLAGNPTTGYNWAADKLDTSILQQVGDASFKADSNLIGAGGMVTLKFKAVAAGTTTLTLNYSRSFETGVAPLQTFTVTVNVK
jgi:inhibitor of cysteine peptidase